MNTSVTDGLDMSKGMTRSIIVHRLLKAGVPRSWAETTATQILQDSQGKTALGGTTAEVARVVERFRDFDVQNDDTNEYVRVTYNVQTDSLYCYKHCMKDACTCTSRVRLSGLLKNHVVTV